MTPFDHFARGRDLDGASGRAIDALEVGAALVSQDAYPDVRVDAVRAELDEIARGLPMRNLSRVPAEDAAHVIAHHLYVVHRFRGNEEDYGDPRNSYLSDVLARRTGLPITLAIVMLAVAARTGVAARGVSFPGHFLVRFERPSGGPLVVDPFHRGRVLGFEDLTRLLKRGAAAGSAARLQLRHLEPAPARAVLVRVLTNLKQAHQARGDLARALVAATRIVALLPAEPWAIRDRGLLQAQLGAPAGAKADLTRYLELSPTGPDAANVRAVLSRVQARIDGDASTGRRSVVN